MKHNLFALQVWCDTDYSTIPRDVMDLIANEFKQLNQQKGNGIIIVRLVKGSEDDPKELALIYTPEHDLEISQDSLKPEDAKEKLLRMVPERGRKYSKMKFDKISKDQL